MSNCIECDATLTLPEDARKGEILDCGDCGAELEITNPENGTVVIAESEGEDWGQ